MNDDQPNGNPWLKSLLVWSGIFLALMLAVSLMGSRGETASSVIRYSDFRAKVAEGRVAEVQIGDERIVGKYKNDETFSALTIPGDTTLPKLLEDNGVRYAGKAPEERRPCCSTS